MAGRPAAASTCMVMPNFFVRGEFEYIGFTEAQGIQAHIGTARVGAGFKF